jgi:hypothetical protein
MTGHRTLFLVLVFIHLTSAATAATVTSTSSKLLDKELRAVLDAKSSDNLDAVISDYDEIRSLRNECDVQLDRQKLPSLCFRVLLKEERAGFIAAQKVKQQQAWLDQLCVRRLRVVQDRSDIRKLLSEPSLPRACRTAAEERAADLKYTQESEHPSHLFKERHLDSEEGARSLQAAPLI